MSGYNKQQIRLRLNHDIKPHFTVMPKDNGREFHFIFDDFILDSNISEARIYILKPSGKEIYNQCQIAESEVIVKSTTQMLAEPGNNIGAIQLIYSSNELEKVTSFPFIMCVHKDVIDESSIESKDEFSILDSLINEARKLIIDVEEAESLRNSAEQERILNENERKTAENNRKTAESMRNENETARQTAESNRVEAENTRVNAEAERVNAENTRRSQEETRKTAESLRVNAENKRVSQETSRANAEKARVSAENDRAAAESGRETAEHTRANNEETRKTAESVRIGAENTRVSQETSRVNAEKARVSAENKRVTAETGRENAENRRQTDTSKAIENCNAAADRANKAVENLGNDKVDKDDVIDTSAGIRNNTKSEKIAGALAVKELFLAVHPVGCIYMSTSSTNPGTLFGGTWAAWGAGRVPVGINTGDDDFKTVEKTGGAKSNSFAHSHTVNSHTHDMTHSHTVSSHTHDMTHSHTVNSHAHSTANHTLTVSEIPAHNHQVPTFSESAENTTTGGYNFRNVWANRAVSNVNAFNTGGSGTHNHGNTGNSSPSTNNGTKTATGGASPSTNNGTKTATGGASPGTDSKLGTVSNLQPYITCYMWKRTA